MRYALVTVIIFIATGFIYSAKAQQQIFKNYTVNDGLVSNTVRNVFQDSKGFLWIATNEGLSKYDGSTFKNFTTANGLAHNFVNDFYEGKDGKLFVALNNGTIDIIANDKVISKPLTDTIVVNEFIPTPWQDLIVTTDNKGLQVFNNGKFTKPIQDFPSASYITIAILNDSTFITTGEEICVFNKHYKRIAQIANPESKFNEIKIYQDKKNRIWLGTNVGLRMMAGISSLQPSLTYLLLPSVFDIPALKQKKINDIFEDSDGVLWFATVAGIVKINTNGTHQLITVKDGLASNIITSIFQDREKNIWFGTVLGLSKLVTKNNISLYNLENGIWSSENSYLFYPINKEKFLVSTSKGTQIFNKQSGTFKPINKTSSEIFYSTIKSSITPLFQSMDRIASFDTTKLQFENTTLLPLKKISKIIADKDGNFFLSDIYQLFFNAGSKLEKVLKYRITYLLLDKQGDLWAGTWTDGLFRIRYSFIDDNFKIIKTSHFLTTENIRSLFEDSHGNIWAGTRYQGVYHFVKNGQDSFRITKFDQNNGLTSNWVKAIREDAKGNFWIAYYAGLDKLIKTAHGFRVFNFSKINNYFGNIIGMEIDNQQSIWLITGEGLTQIQDGELEKLPALPVYITKVFSQDSIYPLQEKKIELTYQQNQLQFEFSAPGYINEKQLLYSYRLSATVEGEWTVATNQHFVSFASLQPDSYLFEVRMLGWNGEWGVPASFEFFISPPFWKTWWFISLVALFTLLLGFLFVKGREKSFKAIAREKLKVQQLNAEQYKSKLELERIINYFSTSLIDKKNTDEVLWDVAKNLIAKLGFVDCMIYLWNKDKTKMIQKACIGPKGSVEEINKQPFEVLPGQGLVGYVTNTKQPLIVPDTSKDSRYRQDEIAILSEITIPIIYNNELLGIIDSEHPEKNFYTQQHLQLLTTVAALMADKIKSIEAEELQQQTAIEMYSMNEQLLKAKLEALQSQMNPHFIFNSLNSIDNLIQTNQKEKATTYLARFAKLIRNVLESSKNDLVAFQKDYETLELYLQMEQFRSNNKFTYELLAEEELLQSDYKVLPLIVQPFVENAIHHGLLNKQIGKRNLSISATLENDYIKYTIIDNGVGRAKAQQLKEMNKPEQQSYGIDITTERIQLYNQTNRNSDVIITDIFENNEPVGTRVELRIKIFENN
jgi:ligand-binding sensor domain-containing protein/putative methionine-R-sulfoxide reductase with GAF domain/anti-sigma regulatory factor (Ser/Thr protein kinase)